MLHARIAYPKRPEAGTGGNPKREEKSAA